MIGVAPGIASYAHTAGRQCLVWQGGRAAGRQGFVPFELCGRATVNLYGSAAVVCMGDWQRSALSSRAAAQCFVWDNPYWQCCLWQVGSAFYGRAVVPLAMSAK